MTNAEPIRCAPALPLALLSVCIHPRGVGDGGSAGVQSRWNYPGAGGAVVGAFVVGVAGVAAVTGGAVVVAAATGRVDAATGRVDAATGRVVAGSEA